MNGRLAVVGKIYRGMGRLLKDGFIEVEGDLIKRVGKRDELDYFRGQKIEFGRGVILPGFMDSHIHLCAFSLSLVRLDLTNACSLENALEMIRTKAMEIGMGKWVVGRGWDKQRWGLEGFPDRWILDKVSPSNPVAIDSHDGHLLWVNSLALREAGLLESIPEIDGGEIETDANGCPTGILKEKAVSLVKKLIPTEESEFLLDAIEVAERKLLGLGITCVHTIESPEYGVILDSAVKKGVVPLEIYRMQEVGCCDDLRDLPSTVKCVKIYADGALGSQTASMFEPYCGQPNNRGIIATSSEQIKAIGLKAAQLGLAVAVHAIGDRANRDVLDAFAVIRKEVPQALLRIEHAQILRDVDFKRFAEIGVIASMQPIHAVSDMDVANLYWGSRCRTAYAWRSLKDAGVTIAFGSDAPIESPNPFKGLHAAVTRSKQDIRGTPSWHPEQCLSLSEAIDAYTIGGAVACGMSSILGSIDPGKKANLVVTSDDIFATPDPDLIIETTVKWAMVMGEPVDLAT